MEHFNRKDGPFQLFQRKVVNKSNYNLVEYIKVILILCVVRIVMLISGVTFIAIPYLDGVLRMLISMVM